MDVMGRADLLIRAGFNLQVDAAHALAGDARGRRLSVGDFLFLEGDPGTTLYVVESGRVEAFTASNAGRELVFRRMGPGSMIGELTILDGSPRTAGVRAVEPSRLFGISRKVFLEHAHREPEVGLALAQLCASRARDLSQWASKSSFSTLEARLSTTLLTLAANERSGPVITITQQALGNRLGVSRESINKWLRRWERDGLVTLGRRSIRLVDHKRLEAAALT